MCSSNRLLVNAIRTYRRNARYDIIQQIANPGSDCHISINDFDIRVTALLYTGLSAGVV